MGVGFQEAPLPLNLNSKISFPQVIESSTHELRCKIMGQGGHKIKKGSAKYPANP